MKAALARLDVLPTRPYVFAAALVYATLRTVPAYLAVSGSLGLATLTSVIAFAWVVLLLVLAVRRRQLAVLRAAAEFTAALLGGWVLAVLATTPARTTVAPSLTVGAFLLPLLAVSLLAIPILAFPVASLLILAGRRLTGRAA